MCSKFCTLPALFVKIIFNFKVVVREADARRRFQEIYLALGLTVFVTSSWAAASEADSRWPPVDALLHFLPVCMIAQTRWDLRPSSPKSSFARDPTIDTRHSPGRLLRTCSSIACTSVLIAASPVLCNSTNTDISFPFYKEDARCNLLSSPRQTNDNHSTTL